MSSTEAKAAAAGIVYDDDEVRVIWHPGHSDFLLVTFGDLMGFAKGSTFFAERPAQKARLAALGFMAKRGNWYPPANMQAAAVAVAGILGQYADRVLYGGSMGGYGAVKFSRLLGASQVIALCPQWTIDRGESEGVDPGWQDYFVPSMRGMGVQAGDLGGEIFLFADARDVRDMWHCRMIMRASPGVRFINIPTVGHHVTAVFAGTENLLQLIARGRAGDVSGLRALGRRVRKDNFHRKNLVIKTAINRFPDWGIALLANAARTEPRLVAESPQHFMRALEQVAQRQGLEAARGFYEAVWTALDRPMRQLLACAQLARAGGEVVIETFHGTRLIYAADRNLCVHGAELPSPMASYVKLEMIGDAAALFVTIGGTRFYLTVDRQGSLVVPFDELQDENPRPFEISRVRQGRFTIRRAGAFVTASKGKWVGCKKANATEWETFRFSVVA